MPPSHRGGTFPVKVILHAIFLLSGITTVMIGQILPLVIGRFGLNDLKASYFFPAQFSGSILGTLLTNWFGSRNSYVQAAVLGGFSMAIGVLMMDSGSYWLCLVGFFVNGVGVGLTLPSVNMLILEMDPLRPAAALNILNFCWGIGAIVCKPFIDGLSTTTSFLVPAVLLAICFFVLSTLLIINGKGIEQLSVPIVESTGKTAIWSTAFAWILALFNFVHVGYESGMGGWLTTYSERIDPAGSIRVFSPTLIFYLFFVAGRGVAPLYLRRVSENTAMFINLTIILIGMIMTIYSDSAVLLSLGAGISGFGTSSVFPTSLARFGRVFGAGASRRIVPLFIAGTAGSIAIAWLIGFISEFYGGLRSGMYVLAVSIVILMILQIGIGSVRKTLR